MEPGKKLLILDLDETLIHATKHPLLHAHDFLAGPYWVYKRPFLQEFLTAVSQWYDFAVWTSASASYARIIVTTVFPTPEALAFVWSGERCTQRRDLDNDEYYWVKDLAKVKKCGFALEQVVMLDDSPEKLERHYGNLLRVRPFIGDPADTELKDILHFLEHLAMVENVRTIEKRFWRTFQTNK